MSRRNPNVSRLLVIGTTSLILFASVRPVWADAGHDHSESAEAAPSDEANGPVSVAGFGETFDLTVIYEPFAEGESVALRIFLANLETNKPVSDAEIALTLTGPDTDAAIPVVPVPDSPGEYSAEVSLRSDADFSFLVEVSISDDFDLFSVDGFSTVEEEAVESLEGDSTSIWDFKTYFLVGGYVVVALAAYSLGMRSRRQRRPRTDAGNVQDVNAGDST